MMERPWMMMLRLIHRGFRSGQSQQREHIPLKCMAHRVEGPIYIILPHGMMAGKAQKRLLIFRLRRVTFLKLWLDSRAWNMPGQTEELVVAVVVL